MAAFGATKTGQHGNFQTKIDGLGFEVIEASKSPAKFEWVSTSTERRVALTCLELSLYLASEVVMRGHGSSIEHIGSATRACWLARFLMRGSVFSITTMSGSRKVPSTKDWKTWRRGCYRTLTE
jgi:hypothetical protein